MVGKTGIASTERRRGGGSTFPPYSSREQARLESAFARTLKSTYVPAYTTYALRAWMAAGMLAEHVLAYSLPL